MKNNRLYTAMSYLDDALIDEALQTPKKRNMLPIKLTAAAAVLCLIALSAALLVNVRQQPETTNTPTADRNPSALQNPEQPDTLSVIDQTSRYTAPGTRSAESNPASDTLSPEEKTSRQADSRTQAGESSPDPASLPTNQESGKQDEEQTRQEGDSPTPSTLETSTAPSNELEETSDMLGFIILDGVTYMQITPAAEYTPDRELGNACDFPGFYSGMNDGSKVYTVQEDPNILVVKFSAGSTVTLMRYEPEDGGYFRFEGLRVSPSLMAALNSRDGKTYSVTVTRPDSESMNSFAYNGRTIGQIKEEMNAAQKQLAIRLWIIGEANETGLKTAWGEDFLALAESIREEYRLPGAENFDLDRANEDALQYEQAYESLYEELQGAYHAFLKVKIREIYDILTANGIQAELVNEVRCNAEMTREQFIALGRSGDYREFAFDLRDGSEYLTDDPNA